MITGPITINVSVRLRFWTLPLMRAVQVVAPRVVPRRMQDAFVAAVAAFLVRFGVRTVVSQ